MLDRGISEVVPAVTALPLDVFSLPIIIRRQLDSCLARYAVQPERSEAGIEK